MMPELFAAQSVAMGAPATEFGEQQPLASAAPRSHTFVGNDMGGPGDADVVPIVAPGDVIGGGGAAEMRRCLASRKTKSWAFLLKRLSDQATKDILTEGEYFQDGFKAFKYLRDKFDHELERTDINDLDEEWLRFSILKHVGINENSITEFLKLLTRHNADYPIGKKKTGDQIAEKILYSIMKTSAYLSQPALKEYNAEGADRTYKYTVQVIGLHEVNDRDVQALTKYFSTQWKAGVRNGHIGPAPATGENAGRSASSAENDAAAAAAAAAAEAEAAAVQPLQCDAEAGLALICDNCRGLGHVESQCPSPKAYRTFALAEAVNKLAGERAVAKAAWQPRS